MSPISEGSCPLFSIHQFLFWGQSWSSWQRMTPSKSSTNIWLHPGEGSTPRGGGQTPDEEAKISTSLHISDVVIITWSSYSCTSWLTIFPTISDNISSGIHLSGTPGCSIHWFCICAAVVCLILVGEWKYTSFVGDCLTNWNYNLFLYFFKGRSSI